MANNENNGNNHVYCDYCGRREDEVQYLIPSPTGLYICDKCLDGCNRLVDEHFGISRNGRLFVHFPTQNVAKTCSMMVSETDSPVSSRRGAMASSTQTESASMVRPS